MSWHKRYAFVVGAISMYLGDRIHSWWVGLLWMIPLSAVAAAISHYLDRKEPFAK